MRHCRNLWWPWRLESTFQDLCHKSFPCRCWIACPGRSWRFPSPGCRGCELPPCGTMISSAPLRTWGSCCWSRTLPRIPAISGSLCWCPICPSRSSWTRLSGGPQVAALIFVRPALVQTFCSGLGCSPSSWCTMQACIGQSQLHPWLLRLCNVHKENRHYQETRGTSSNWMIPRVQAHGTWQLVRPTEPCAVCPCWILLLLSLQWKSPSGRSVHHLWHSRLGSCHRLQSWKLE